MSTQVGKGTARLPERSSCAGREMPSPSLVACEELPASHAPAGLAASQVSNIGAPANRFCTQVFAEMRIEHVSDRNQSLVVECMLPEADVAGHDSRLAGPDRTCRISR